MNQEGNRLICGYHFTRIAQCDTVASDYYARLRWLAFLRCTCRRVNFRISRNEIQTRWQLKPKTGNALNTTENRSHSLVPSQTVSRLSQSHCTNEDTYGQERKTKQPKVFLRKVSVASCARPVMLTMGITMLQIGSNVMAFALLNMHPSTQYH